MSTNHKIITKQPEIFQGSIPQNVANQISDWFKAGKSVNQVIGALRIDGKKVPKTLVETMYKHIEEIEDSMIKLLDGTSLMYDASYNPEGVEEIPETEQALRALILINISISEDTAMYANIYDVANLTELAENVNYVISNILEVNGGFDKFKNAVLNQ